MDHHMHARSSEPRLREAYPLQHARVKGFRPAGGVMSSWQMRRILLMRCLGIFQIPEWASLLLDELPVLHQGMTVFGRCSAKAQKDVQSTEALLPDWEWTTWLPAP